MTLACTVLIQIKSVTNGQTDRQTPWRWLRCMKHYMLSRVKCTASSATTLPTPFWPNTLHSNTHLADCFLSKSTFFSRVTTAKNITLIIISKCIKHIRDLFEYVLYKFTLCINTLPWKCSTICTNRKMLKNKKNSLFKFCLNQLSYYNVCTVCLSACLSALSSAFPVAWLRTPTTALESLGLGYVPPPAPQAV